MWIQWLELQLGNEDMLKCFQYGWDVTRDTSSFLIWSLVIFVLKSWIYGSFWINRTILDGHLWPHEWVEPKCLFLCPMTTTLILLAAKRRYKGKHSKNLFTDSYRCLSSSSVLDGRISAILTLSDFDLTPDPQLCDWLLFVLWNSQASHSQIVH